MKKKLLQLSVVVIAFAALACSYNFLDKPELAAQYAPKQNITLNSELKATADLSFHAGNYTPLRRFANGTIYMLPNRYVKFGANGRKVGGIYWKDGLAKPDSVCYYLSEAIPTIEKSSAVSRLF